MAQTDKQQQLALMQQMVAQRSWVKTPWNYTKLSGGLSLIQQQALLMVSEHLQGYIHKFFDLKLDKAHGKPKSLFTDYVLEQGIPPFRIYLADLGVQPNHYKETRRVIEEINLKVEHPEFDEDGRPTGKTTLTNVFSQFGFEDTGDYYHFTDDDGKRQPVMMKQPYIDVKINPDVAMWAFDMSQGYVSHLKMIALYATKRPTPRVYLLLMRELKRDQARADIRIPLSELKEYLGIVPYTDRKTGEVVTPLSHVPLVQAEGARCRAAGLAAHGARGAAADRHHVYLRPVLPRTAQDGRPRGDTLPCGAHQPGHGLRHRGQQGAVADRA